jgi:hypothetical protein
MTYLFQVMDVGQFNNRVLDSQRVEGTPQYCSGYEKALRDFFPNNEVVAVEILEEYTKTKK